MTTSLRLSIVSPFFDEVEVVDLFYAALRSVLDDLTDVESEIIFVDDGSTDGTLDRLNAIAAKDDSVRVYSLSRNFGHQIAITAGLDAATGDAVVMLDSDLQHPPELIRDMLEQWKDGYDVVTAVRKNDGVQSFFKEHSARLFYRLINRITHTPIAQGVADFCLLSRRAYETLRTMREHHRFVRGLVSWMGFRRTSIDYKVQHRAAGRSKYTLPRMIAFALNGIFAFSSAPLRLATRSGILLTTVGFAYLVWILCRALFTDDLIAGWASLIGVTLVLGGAQILFIGLIGEYLARMFDEVKGRPLYVLKQSPGNTRSGDGRPRNDVEISTE